LAIEVTPPLPPAEAYVMSPDELDKLQKLFLSYDKDHDGYEAKLHYYTRRYLNAC
jgi:hypothetical protein